MADSRFDAYAGRYDAWYNSDVGRPIFATEVACLRPFLHRQPGPYLELGVGSGRFAQALGIEYGVDPAPGLLGLARARGIRAARARGESLPFPDEVFGEVLIALTLCFVREPERVLEESRRVLRPGGGLVLGLILKESPWAEFYARKGKEGHPIYSEALFFGREEVEALLHFAGFEAFEYRSCLFQPPGLGRYVIEEPVAGHHPSAGFVALSAQLGGQSTSPIALATSVISCRGGPVACLMLPCFQCSLLETTDRITAHRARRSWGGLGPSQGPRGPKKITDTPTRQMAAPIRYQ